MRLPFTAAICALGLLTPAAALAADAQVTATIHQFIDSFNKGDIKAAEATQAADVVIVDEPPPYVWKGPGAFQAWLGDLDRDAKAHGQTDQSVTLGAPAREEVSGDNAYVIVPATYAFKEKGVAMREPSRMTFALKKTAEGWKISAWTWTGPRATPAK
jgi:ketosteroid isomerase-like protein